MTFSCLSTQIDELPLINSIIIESKSHWPYDEAYLEAALPLLRVDESWLKSHLGFTLRTHEAIAGFMGLERGGDVWLLEHLWIRPSAMTRGTGRAAVSYAIELARSQQVRILKLWPDPPAEGFYRRVGARYTGEITASRIAGGPLFHEMAFEI